MRLLKARILEFEVFYSETPPYAILSYTWGSGDEEPTFQDLKDASGALTQKQGYLKIKDCCARAIKYGLEYVWIDTCCIDKTNSVELQEALNSNVQMVSWFGSMLCVPFRLFGSRWGISKSWLNKGQQMVY